MKDIFNFAQDGGVEECISTETIIQPRPLADRKPR